MCNTHLNIAHNYAWQRTTPNDLRWAVTTYLGQHHRGNHYYSLLFEMKKKKKWIFIFDGRKNGLKDFLLL